MSSELTPKEAMDKINEDYNQITKNLVHAHKIAKSIDVDSMTEEQVRRDFKETLETLIETFEVLEGAYDHARVVYSALNAATRQQERSIAGLSNLTGGLAALLDDRDRPIPCEVFDSSELMDDKYIIFNKEEFNTWLKGIKTILGQIEDVIDGRTKTN